MTSQAPSGTGSGSTPNPPASSAARVRSLFLDYFRRQGHTVVRSSPLVPSDPTLLFTNAGMVQFKDVFTGQKKVDYARAATAQKCVRAGGKHNDLDNVGRTARHHTFFEMLGNFSFGDYFKEGAISYAWEFLTRELALDPKRMVVSVFAGEPSLKLGPDDEARALWKKVSGFSDDRIFGLGMKDNFWMMGDTGPQGPCSEIHYWLGDGAPELARFGDEPLPDGRGWVEIWNLVFMQFEKKTKDSPLLPLPRPSIDTGAGLERVTVAVADQRSNYDTDLFTPLIDTVAHASGRAYGRTDNDYDVGMRVLADHGRATAMLISDGVLPSNLNRGYVLRSIMRRAIRFAVRLDLPAGFFARLCLQVTEMLGDIYPELVKARSLIEKAVNAEDEGFRATIHRGLRLIADTKFEARESARVLPGAVAFQLHDTYGFPLDLTQVIGREQGFSVDESGFHEEMRKQRERSKFQGSGDQAVGASYHAVRAEKGPTKFVGYLHGGEGEAAKAKILALLVDGERVTRAAEGQEVDVITDQTPFYARSGGQVGDTGKILCDENAGEVLDTLKPLADLHVHKVRVVSGHLDEGAEVMLRVDGSRRDLTRKNHSATHLLHHALRAVLGEHVTQKGSYVGPDKLTFDFSHFSPLTEDERRKVERLVNEAVQKNAEARAEEMGFDDAQKQGAMALFGEKYGDRVRVLSMGTSVELCGGTHVQRTGDIGLFKLVSETGIAKGVRRIEALTGPGAEEHVLREETQLARAAEALRSAPLEVADRVSKLLDELKARDKEIAALRGKLAAAGGSGLYSEERQVGELKVAARRVEAADPKALREVAEQLADKLKTSVLALGGVAEGKASLVVVVDKALAAANKAHAGKLVAGLAALVGGRGGGRADVAQAGGSDVSKLDAALAAVFDLVASQGS
ncbi:MAG: alanine--tRNA ligase [Polyangia bacterium]